MTGPSSSTSPSPAEPVVATITAREQVRAWVIALVLALAARAGVAESRWIPSESMVPTLAVGDRVMVEKVSLQVGEPRRGAIIVFRPKWDRHPPPWLQRLGLADDNAMIKRVIGLPGEVVRVTGGRVYVDDHRLEEPYAVTARLDMAPEKVPEGSLFVLGDNRNNSADSRIWGMLPRDHVVGRAVWRYWPPGRMGRL